MKTSVNLLETLVYLCTSHGAAFMDVYAHVDFQNQYVQFLLRLEVHEAAQQGVYRAVH